MHTGALHGIHPGRRNLTARTLSCGDWYGGFGTPAHQSCQGVEDGWGGIEVLPPSALSCVGSTALSPAPVDGSYQYPCFDSALQDWRPRVGMAMNGMLGNTSWNCMTDSSIDLVGGSC